MSPRVSLTEPLHFRAVRWGFDENDPTLVRAVEAVRKLKKGEVSSAEADAALGPLIESWIKKVREGPPRFVAGGSNGISAATLRTWAQQAGIDENDAILTRALKAEEKAEDWASLLEMQIAAMAFIEGHFEVKDAWPPESGRIGSLLQKFSRGRAKPAEIEEFRQLAGEVLRDWQPEYSPGFKTRIESALSWLDDPNREEKMPDN